jgi:hypothetical protein
MRKGGWILSAIGGLLLLISMLTYASWMRYNQNIHATRARDAIVQTLGIISLALSYECSATRNPLEGLCSSMNDIPGAYVYHTDCDVVEPSLFPAETRYRLKVRHK